jgi:hypothetical protein
MLKAAEICERWLRDFTCSKRHWRAAWALDPVRADAVFYLGQHHRLQRDGRAAVRALGPSRNFILRYNFLILLDIIVKQFDTMYHLPRSRGDRGREGREGEGGVAQQRGAAAARMPRGFAGRPEHGARCAAQAKFLRQAAKLAMPDRHNYQWPYLYEVATH